jgi:predicted dehydrogenase
MANTLRWGIIGTGNIARQFAAGMNSSPRGKIVAVGSRSTESAAAFASQFSVVSAYGSYESLLTDRDVDAVYLSTPNSTHHEWTIKALRAGKHVLCEKPFATSQSQSQEMFDVAEKSGKMLVEAFMYRSHPQTQSILETIRSGAIGEVKIIKTSFCYRTTRIDGNIRFNRDLAGGSLMDVGCYCLDFSRLIAGEEPDKIQAVGKLHASGVDEWAGGTLHFRSGIVASFVCGMTVQGDNSAHINGSEGYLEIGWPWKPQATATYTISHSIPPKQDAKGRKAQVRPEKQEISVKANGELYALEADDFAATVLDGAPPRITRDQTLGNMAALDEIRRQIGVKF